MSFDGLSYLLTLLEDLSRYVQLKPAKRPRANAAARGFDNIVCGLGPTEAVGE